MSLKDNCIASIARNGLKEGTLIDINRLKQQLVVVRGNVAPWEANLELIGEIRLELQQQFDKFEEEKAKQKEMYDH